MSFNFWEEDLMILMELVSRWKENIFFAILEKIFTHQYFCYHTLKHEGFFWRKYFLPLVNWKGYRIIWLHGGVLDSKKRNGLTVWMEFGQCGLLPRQETLMGMELHGECMNFWSFVYERTVVRAGIFPKKIFLSRILVNWKGNGIFLLYWGIVLRNGIIWLYGCYFCGSCWNGGSITLSVINVNIGFKILWIIWEFGSTWIKFNLYRSRMNSVSMLANIPTLPLCNVTNSRVFGSRSATLRMITFSSHQSHHTQQDLALQTLSQEVVTSLCQHLSQ
jgi:hypothetical protein